MTVETLKATIGGMHCAACSSRIERVVGKLEGVDQCQVNLATTRAKIVYDPQSVSKKAIEETISGLGFSVAEDSGAAAADPSAMSERELTGMRRRLVPAFVLAMAIMTISMSHMVGVQLPAFIRADTAPVTHALSQLLLLLPVLYLGRNFYLSGMPALLRGGPNMDSLIAIGTGAAVIYSCWNTVEILLGHIGRAHDLYFESAAMLLSLISLGKYLEARAKNRTSDAIRQLMELAPDTALLVEEEGVREVAVDTIEVGDRLLIKPGARIPVDGKAVNGKSAVDESMLTGESMPVEKNEGDVLYGGTLNTNGTLTMETTKIGGDMVLARIVKLVQDAQGSKAPIANLADRISYYFVPTVIVIGTLAGLWWFFIGGADFSYSLRIFISVLVIACPCAMGLATPTSIMVGTGRGAQLGILIKTGNVLEYAQQLTCIVFDKTGTLTRGQPQLTDFITVGDLEADTALGLIAGAEEQSEHALAGAVVRGARDRNITPAKVRSFDALPGRGIRATATLNDKEYRLLFGNMALMQENDVNHLDSDNMGRTEQLTEAGKTVLYLSVDDRLEALLGVADPLKEEAGTIVEKIAAMGLRRVMLTGDNDKTARAVARQAGISEVVSGVLPDKKEEEIRKLQAEGELVAMVGDGINDAPALARADVGIAMGTGIDVALESADIVLMQDHLSGVLRAIDLSKATMRNIRQNLFWAFAYNVVGIPIAAGVLTIFGGPTLNPMIAGAAMALSSVSVVSNALRLRWYSPPDN